MKYLIEKNLLSMRFKRLRGQDYLDLVIKLQEGSVDFSGLMVR